MGLRTATATTGTREERRTTAQWRALVEQTVADAARASRAGDLDELAATFERIDAWDDPQRAYQARCQATELVLAVGSTAPDRLWGPLYAKTAEVLLRPLEREPREPVLLNALGVLLYELADQRGAKACFEAAQRLDPELPHVARNLAQLQERSKRGGVAPLPKGLAARARTLGARAEKLARGARPVPGLTLSLCMIVKDEEEMLPGCLEAIAPAVDEIVVVDTGSSDRTVEIAEEFGAKVVEFPWNGSFSDARNVSLEHATSDWIIYLDADEHLFVEDAPLLRELLGKTWREGFHLVETNYTGGDESGHAVTHTALRLFRNRPSYRFEGRIHEQKTHTMPTFVPERFETTRIRLRHYGYLKNRLVAKDKSKRNIELLEEERREAPSPFNSFNLGSEYMALGDWDEARRYLDEAWRGIREIEGFENVPYVPLLVSRVVRARREAGDLDAARASIDEALRVFPDHTDIVFEQGLCAREDGDLEGAARYAERCLDMGDAPSKYAATVGSGTHLALTLLGDVRGAQGRTSDAEALYRRALAEHPDFIAPVLPLASLMLRRGAPDEEVAAAIDTDRPSSLLLLATAYHECERHTAAEESFRTVLARQPGNSVARIGLVESLLSQRRYEDAEREAAAEPEDSPAYALALLGRLFAAAVRGDAALLAELVERSRGAAGLATAHVELYEAWRAALAGAPVAERLSAGVVGPIGTALEALLRVQEFEAFEQLAALLERVAVTARVRRELLANMYLRRGYLESAADEWIAVCEEAPDEPALVGLAQIALAKGLPDDALAFAESALALAPESLAASRIATVVRQRLGGVAAVPAA